MFQTGSNKSLPFHDSLGFFVLISHQFSFELCSITLGSFVCSEIPLVESLNSSKLNIKCVLIGCECVN